MWLMIRCEICFGLLMASPKGEGQINEDDDQV